MFLSLGGRSCCPEDVYLVNICTQFVLLCLLCVKSIMLFLLFAKLKLLFILPGVELKAKEGRKEGKKHVL